MKKLQLKEKKDSLLEKARIFFTIDNEKDFDITDLSKMWRRFWSFMQVVLRTANGFAEKRQGFQAVALSYFGIMAFVPFLALLFAVTGGLGLADAQQWHELLAKVSFLADKPEITDWIVSLALNIVNQAKEGGVGLVSALLFIWTIIWLFFQVERVFNFVWKTDNKRDRNLLVRFSWFIGMLFLLPLVLILFSGAFVINTNLFKFMDLNLGILNLSAFMSFLLMVAIGTLTFSLMFKYIPEVRVKYRYALSSALVTSVIFFLFQYLYLETQMFVTRLNGVYGVMAAIPLFLIWMNISWQIILYGANLTKAVQDFREGEEFAFTNKNS